ncbi:hypothetical protein [Nonomuraea sp. NPDC050540]
MPGTLSILITVFDDDERRRAASIWSSALRDREGLRAVPDIVAGTHH